ncbi:MAG: manganese efflux pump [Syntrophomonadaceae bacterium]|nr:manganese efflux pump [Syntrophomonadaceae bacterium]
MASAAWKDMATILAVAVALGADALSVALGMGLSGVGRQVKIRFVTIVAVLHVLMPLVGMQVGLAAGRFLGVWAGWLGALVLFYIGYDMIKSGVKDTETFSFAEGKQALWGQAEVERQPKGSLLAMVIVGVSVSIDALTVGFSLGTARVPVALTVVVMGITAGFMTTIGFIGGGFLGRTVGSRAQVAGGIVLFLLAITMIL